MTNQYPYYWRVKTQLPERFGKRLRVLARGRMNSRLVEFEDGAQFVTSGNYYRKVNIDEKLALVWAKVNMAAAVSETVDKKMLTDFAKNNPDAATYATVVEGKDVRIATDLSKFID